MKEHCNWGEQIWVEANLTWLDVEVQQACQLRTQHLFTPYPCSGRNPKRWDRGAFNISMENRSQSTVELVHLFWDATGTGRWLQLLLSLRWCHRGGTMGGEVNPSLCFIKVILETSWTPISISCWTLWNCTSLVSSRRICWSCTASIASASGRCGCFFCKFTLV